MANSKYEYIREYEDCTDTRLPRDTYVVVRLDGQSFHQFAESHEFSKPNDKRALDLMIAAAKHVMREYPKHVSLAYGHSDEFSFLLKSKSNLMQRRYCKLTSLVASAFTSYYVYKWGDYFREEKYLISKESDSGKGFLYKQVDLKYPPAFDARPIVYSNRKLVMDYYKWRQVDCHINNLYNTTLSAMCGKYVRHQLVNIENFREKLEALPGVRLYDHWSNGQSSADKYELIKTHIRQLIQDDGDKKFMTSTDATAKLSGTVSSDKHDIMYLQYNINYNNELEQFKKGTFIVNTSRCDDQTNEPDADSNLKVLSVDAVKNDKFWQQFSYIFDD